MQWNAAGIHEVECVQEGYSLGYLGSMQGNAEDYMLNAGWWE